MHISLWQQFSSNHSASYTVVGEFQSPEAAQEAADIVLRIMRESAKWCFDNIEECRQLKAPNPIEIQYGIRYGFDWKERVDWLTYAAHEWSIHKFDRLVVIEPEHVDTWQTGHQFANLLSAMGAQVARHVMEGVSPDGEHDIWMSMGIEIRCDTGTPDRTENLIEILTSVLALMRSERVSYHVPWFIFHPKLKEFTDTQIFELETHFLKDDERWRALLTAHPKMRNEMLHELWNEVRTLTHDQWTFIRECRDDVRISRATVTQEANELIVQELLFRNIPIGLSAFIQYLENSGCSDIRYTIQQY